MFETQAADHCVFHIQLHLQSCRHAHAHQRSSTQMPIWLLLGALHIQVMT